MLKAITAPPGGGKSRHATELMFVELLTSDRMIVTNMDIKFMPWALNGKLQCGLVEYCRRKGYPELAKTVESRIRILTDDETKIFWRVRTKGPPAETIKQNSDTYNIAIEPDKGVFYMIDEAHDHFNAHEWSKVSKEALYYISKHRHTGDDIWIISQAMSNVVKQFRVLVQETVLVRNLGFEKIGMFTLPQATIVSGYLYCPLSFKSEVPMWTVHRRYKGNPAIHECYNTAAALKTMQGAGDVGKKHVRGIHWSFAILGILGGFAALWYVSDAGPKYIVKKQGETQQKRMAEILGRSNEVVEVAQGNLSGANQHSNTQPNIPREPEVTMNGYIRDGEHFTIFLSDGRELSTRDPEVMGLEKNRVNVSGKWLKSSQPTHDKPSLSPFLSTATP